MHAHLFITMIFHAFFDCKVEIYHLGNYRIKVCLPDYASISPNLISYKFRVETTVERIGTDGRKSPEDLPDIPLPVDQ